MAAVELCSILLEATLWERAGPLGTQLTCSAAGQGGRAHGGGHRWYWKQQGAPHVWWLRLKVGRGPEGSGSVRNSPSTDSACSMWVSCSAQGVETVLMMKPPRLGRF